MTTTVSTHGTATGSPLSFGGVLNSEWIKLRTLRSTLWCYVIIVVLAVGLGLLIASAGTGSDTALTHAQQQAAWLRYSTVGVNFGELVSAVLGALVITGEYATGMIRSTFAAVPKRLPAVLAKAIVFAITTFVVTLIALVVTALVIAPMLGGKGIHPDLTDVHVWVGLVGGAGYVALIGLIAFGIGLIVRNGAGGIAGALGLVLVLPIVVSILSAVTRAVWPMNVSLFLPSTAGAALYAYPVAASSAAPVTDGLITLETWQSALVLGGWVAVALVIGLILVRRRDA